MNRKLHNAFLAVTASGFLLVFGLMAAGPSRPLALADSATPSPVIDRDRIAARSAAAVDAGIRDAQAQARDIEARIQARAQAFEAEIDRTAGNASLGDTVASAMAFAAEISTEAALVTALQVLDGGNDQIRQQRVDAAVIEQRHHARRVRGALALPYFSFAQGLRGTGS
ncbi:MAG: hypothetical protein ACREO8_00240 [Luteimonas sp.]